MSKPKAIIYTDKIYAITFKESGDILTPDTFKKYWPNYGTNSLQGWRAPKKLYYTEAKAKNGFSYIPDGVKALVEISEFTKSRTVIDGEELFASQKAAREVRLEKQEAARAKRKLEYQKIEFERAKAEYERQLKKQQKS